MDTAHLATASKDRTGLFMGKPEFIPSEETGKMIAEWCDSGADPMIEINEAIKKLANCDTVDDLTMFKDTLSPAVVQSPEFKKAGTERYNAIKLKNNANVNP